MQPIKLLMAIALGSKRKADMLFQVPPQPKARRAKSLRRQFTKEFDAYNNAKARCENPCHPQWKDYGGRSIKMGCKSFEEFFLAVGPCPDSPEPLTIDRWPKNNGNYRAGNMRWATYSEQANNRRPKILRAIAEWFEWA
jgi:hypothetical protein